MSHIGHVTDTTEIADSVVACGFSFQVEYQTLFGTQRELAWCHFTGVSTLDEAHDAAARCADRVATRMNGDTGKVRIVKITTLCEVIDY